MRLFPVALMLVLLLAPSGNTLQCYMCDDCEEVNEETEIQICEANNISTIPPTVDSTTVTENSSPAPESSSTTTENRSSTTEDSSLAPESTSTTTENSSSSTEESSLESTSTTTENSSSSTEDSSLAPESTSTTTENSSSSTEESSLESTSTTTENSSSSTEDSSLAPESTSTSTENSSSSTDDSSLASESTSTTTENSSSSTKDSSLAPESTSTTTENTLSIKETKVDANNIGARLPEDMFNSNRKFPRFWGRRLAQVDKPDYRCVKSIYKDGDVTKVKRGCQKVTDEITATDICATFTAAVKEQVEECKVCNKDLCNLAALSRPAAWLLAAITVLPLLRLL